MTVFMLLPFILETDHQVVVVKVLSLFCKKRVFRSRWRSLLMDHLRGGYGWVGSDWLRYRVSHPTILRWVGEGTSGCRLVRGVKREVYWPLRSSLNLVVRLFLFVKLKRDWPTPKGLHCRKDWFTEHKISQSDSFFVPLVTVVYQSIWFFLTNIGHGVVFTDSTECIYSLSVILLFNFHPSFNPLFYETLDFYRCLII